MVFFQLLVQASVLGLVQKSKSIGKLLVKVGKSHTVFSQEAKVTNSILTHNCNYTHRPNISTGQVNNISMLSIDQEYPLAKYWETIGEGGEVTQSHLATGLARAKGNESCGCSMTVFIELLKMVRAERGGGLRPMKENISSWRRAGDLLVITLVGQVLTLMATAAALGGLA